MVRVVSRGAAIAWVLLFLGTVCAFAAARPPAEQEKIDWLLARIRSSDAVFLRNGSEYDGEKAASHLKTKLFFAGKRVQTAREFIAGVATRSEESGQPYRIRPKGAGAASASVVPLGDWLLARLLEHEKALSPTPPAR